MSTQRENDYEEGRSRFGSDYKSHLKYYEECLSYLVTDLNGGPMDEEADE